MFAENSADVVVVRKKQHGRHSSTIRIASQRSHQDRFLSIFKSSLQNLDTRIYEVLAEYISVIWLHLFFHIVCSSTPIREGCYITPNAILT